MFNSFKKHFLLTPVTNKTVYFVLPFSQHGIPEHLFRWICPRILWDSFCRHLWDRWLLTVSAQKKGLIRCWLLVWWRHLLKHIDFKITNDIFHLITIKKVKIFFKMSEKTCKTIAVFFCKCKVLWAAFNFIYNVHTNEYTLEKRSQHFIYIQCSYTLLQTLFEHVIV